MAESVGMHTLQSLWKRTGCFLTKLNIALPYDPATMLLGIFQKESKPHFHTNSCTQMFTAALFTIAKTWKQPTCPSAAEWINKRWQLQTEEECSAHARAWPSGCGKARRKRAENATVERPPVARFHTRDVLEEATLLDGEKHRGRQGLGTGGRVRGGDRGRPGLRERVGPG